MATSYSNEKISGRLDVLSRIRSGFNAATATATPLTTSALEAELSSNSMIAFGESVAADANPAITMYRTSAGSRTGRGFRQRLDGSNGPFSWAWGGSNDAYGSETLTTSMQFTTTGDLSVLGILAARMGLSTQMRLVGSTASGAPVSGAFVVGDVSLSRADGKVWICTVAGSPGTWGDSGARSTVTALARSTAAISLTEPWSTGSGIDTYTLDKPGILIRLPGAPGYMANAGDTNGRRKYTAASITGDLDVRVKLAPSTWASGSNQNLAGKYGEVDGRRGWLFGLTGTGTLVFSWATGSGSGTFAQKFSSVAVGFNAGQPGWVRAVMDVNNGASGHTVTFYTSTDGTTWTVLGTPQTSGVVTSIYDNITLQPDYTVGSCDTGTGAGVGDIYQVEIRNGIAGSLVTPTDPTLWTSSSGTLVLYPVVTPVAGTSVAVALTQDSIGGRTVTWSSNISWLGGITPALSTTPAAVDYFQFDCIDGTNWVGRSLTAPPRDTVAAAVKTNTAINAPNPATTAQVATVTLDRAAYPIRLPGSSPGYLTNATGGASFLAASITGDLDVVVKVAPAAWIGTLKTLAGKYETSSNLRGWRFDVTAAGNLQLSWTTDGAAGTFMQAISSVIVPYTGTQVGWVRAVLDVNNGAGASSVLFYTSSDGTAWTQLGTTRVGGVDYAPTNPTSIFNNPTVPYQVGSFAASLAQPFAGDFLYVEIRNGIAGTNIVPTDPSTWTVLTGATSYPALTPVAGTSLKLVLTQDATGGRTVVWPSNVTWLGGVAPTLSAAANAVDCVELDCFDGATWLGRCLNPAKSAATRAFARTNWR